MAAVMPGIAVAHLFVWRARIDRSDEENFARTMLDLPSHLDRFGQSLGKLLANIAVVENWGLVLVMMALAWFLAKRGRALAAVIVLPMLVLYATAVSVTAWPVDTMDGLAPRALTHLLGPLFFVLASALKDRAVARSEPSSC